MNAVAVLLERARVEVETKLGRCARCMRASLLGALASTALLVGVVALGLHPVAIGAAALVATGFGALTLAHAAAYIYRATRPSPLAPARPCCGQARSAELVAPQASMQLQRRPLVPVLLSLPAAFGVASVAQLALVPRAAAQTWEPKVTRTFRKKLTCLPCAGECVFEAFFGYDFVPRSQGGIQVTRFRMTWNQGASGACAPSIDRGMGAFDFQCRGGKECKVTGGNIWQCPCDTRVEFVPLGTSSQEDCTCPNEKNRTAYAQGRCGAPILVEKTCEFDWINIDFRHKVTCSCPDGGITRGDLVVVAQYRNGAITFGGDIVGG